MPRGNCKVRALGSTDLCAGVKGLLERLITHFGLGSSGGEEPCGGVVPTGEDPASWEALSLGKYPLGNSTVSPRDLANLPMVGTCRLALSLAEHLTA